MKTLIQPRTSVLILMILSCGIWRFFVSSGPSFFSNFTPVGAMALFGGCYFSDKIKAYLVPLATLFLSDVFLNTLIYHEPIVYPGFFWIYGSFALIVLLGTFIKQVSITNVIIMAVAAAGLHWFVTDLGLWLAGALYPHTWEGFIACFAAAIPYLKNMLIGNLVFGGMMFGAFELAQQRFPALQKA